MNYLSKTNQYKLFERYIKELITFTDNSCVVLRPRINKYNSFGKNIFIRSYEELIKLVETKFMNTAFYNLYIGVNPFYYNEDEKAGEKNTVALYNFYFDVEYEDKTEVKPPIPPPIIATG